MIKFDGAEFSGTSSGTLTSPQIPTLLFQDSDDLGSLNDYEVKLTINLTNILFDTKVQELVLNLDPYNTISFSSIGGAPTGSFSQSLNGEKADGDDGYDITIKWTGSGGDIDEGESFMYLFSRTDLGDLHAEDFNAFNTSDKKGGPYLAAIHLSKGPAQNADSGWYGGSEDEGGEEGEPPVVPEPLSLLVWAGLLGLVSLRRKRFAC